MKVLLTPTFQVPLFENAVTGFPSSFAKRRSKALCKRERSVQAQNSSQWFQVDKRPASICSSLWTNDSWHGCIICQYLSILSIISKSIRSPEVLCGSIAFGTLPPNRRSPELPQSKGACEFSPAWMQQIRCLSFICECVCSDNLRPKAKKNNQQSATQITQTMSVFYALCITRIWKAPEGPLHFVELDTLSFPRWDVPWCDVMSLLWIALEDVEHTGAKLPMNPRKWNKAFQCWHLSAFSSQRAFVYQSACQHWAADRRPVQSEECLSIPIHVSTDADKSTSGQSFRQQIRAWLMRTR